MRDPKKPGKAPSGSRASGSSAPGVSGDNSDGGYNAGMAVFSYIIGGIIVWSLIGWGLDNLLGTRWFVLAGGLLGAVGGFYLSYKHNLTRSSSTAAGPVPERKHGPEEGSQSNVE
jgi:ATP synthase protein I